MTALAQLLLILALIGAPQAWPPSLSLSTGEAAPGATLMATATVPASAEIAIELQLPPGVSAELLGIRGTTATWRLTVASTAALSRTPRQVVLLLDGAAAASAPLRIWPEGPIVFKIALPLVLQKRE